MNFKLNNNKDLILFHANMQRTTYDKSINILLSPQFYIMKQESLDIKYKYQALNIAPAVMDELLSSNIEYKYSVFKEDDKWTFIAFDEEKIKSFAINYGIDLDLINKIYFAQQVRDKFNVSISLDDKKAIVLLNGIVTIIPKSALDKSHVYNYIDNSFTPNSGGISLSNDSSLSLIDKKSSLILSVIFILFTFIFIFEGSRYSKEIIASQDKLTTTLQKYPSLSSKYSRDSIEQKYKKIDKQQRAIRNFLKKLSSPIRDGAVLSELTLRGTTQKALLETKTDTIHQKIKQKSKSLDLKIESIKNNSYIALESKI